MKNRSNPFKSLRFCKTLLLAPVLLASFAMSVEARDAQTPTEAAEIFFEAVYKLDYEQAWQVLSPHSQAEIIRQIQASEADKKLSDAQIRQWFVEADRSLKRGFWTQLRSGMDILAWHEQRFEMGPAAKNPQAQLVKVMPADVLIYAVQHDNKWFLGYIESFAERLPQKEQKPAPKTNPQTPPKKSTSAKEKK